MSTEEKTKTHGARGVSNTGTAQFNLFRGKNTKSGTRKRGKI
jgi:hypothetical protein